MKEHITRINFVHVGRKEGCTCDRCGQYITNIWYVDFSNGQRITFGIDCFEKVYKSGNLSKYGLKLFKQLLKDIQYHQKWLAYWNAATEDQARADGQLAFTIDCPDWDNSYWKGKPFEEYRNFEIECYTKYLADDQKELEKFRKVGFEI